MLITLAGVIGSGKSSLTEILADKLGTKPFFEPVEKNPVLPLFYQGNKEAEEKRKNGEKATNPYAFLLQTYFLNKRFAMIKEAMQQDNNILDRSIYEDAIFMKMNTEMGNATEEEYEVYKDLLDNMLEELPLASHKKRPDLMILIKVSYDTMIKRIKKRGRGYEQVENDPSLEAYYKRLIEHYEEWAKEYNASPLLVIDGDKYDFMNNSIDRGEVLMMIYRKLFEVKSINKHEFLTLCAEA